MIIRKSSIAFAACSTFTPLHLSAYSQSSTSSNARRQRGTRAGQQIWERRREYATVAGDPRESPEQQQQPEKPDTEHVWPDTPKGLACPTPYQILETKANASYSKAKYYQLVKLYHPDLEGCSRHDLSGHLRIERYRLIVAAHTILSDPVKRSAYDRFGAGWSGKAEVSHPDTWRQPSPYHSAGPFSQSWHDPADPIWQNATWEDWERWHQQREGTHPEKRAPVYMANSYFLAMLVGLAVVGSSLNYNRAQDAGHYYIEQRDLVHDRAAKELRRVRQEASTLTSKQDRIEYFVRQREATLGTGDPEALSDERANRVFKDREVCSSEQVRDSQG